MFSRAYSLPGGLGHSLFEVSPLAMVGDKDRFSRYLLEMNASYGLSR
jgi:hypothetical protein